jgi:hypothetical protein
MCEVNQVTYKEISDALSVKKSGISEVTVGGKYLCAEIKSHAERNVAPPILKFGTFPQIYFR